MHAALIRTLAIVLAFACGFFLPELNDLSWLIRWFIIGMLFITFLGVRLTKLKPSGKHWLLIAANLVIGIGSFALLKALGHDKLAVAAFFVGITPTATAAPVIMGFLGGRVEFVISSLILSNTAICALLPLMMPSVVDGGKGGLELYGQITGSVGLVMLLPAALAFCVRKCHKSSILWPRRLKNISFGAWIACLILISAHASHDIRNNSALSDSIIWEIGAVSLIICALNFTIGYLIGGKQLKRECSQSLGQKNTTLTIFLAIMYANPTAALGPTFYVLWHNLWNAWQLHRHSKKNQTPGIPKPEKK